MTLVWITAEAMSNGRQASTTSVICGVQQRGYCGCSVDSRDVVIPL